MTSLGDRMKNNYEYRYRIRLTKRTPAIIRLDGKCFHQVTKGCDKPFDEKFSRIMLGTARYLLDNIQGAKLAYIQSDEISLLLTDFDRLTTDAWFDYIVQKMVSISAAMASVCFSGNFNKFCFFDSRVFNIPKEEVCNYFIWRQVDWIRNSVQMLGQSKFSHKQLHKKSCADIHEMLHGVDINWAKLEDKWKNGICVLKRDNEIFERHDLIFTKDRESVEQYLKEVEE